MSILLLLLLTRFLTLYRVNLERVTSCEKKPSKPELNQLFHDVKYSIIHFFIQKQLSRGVFRKLYSENLQPIYKRTTMPKSDFNKVEKHLWWTASDFFFFSPIAPSAHWNEIYMGIHGVYYNEQCNVYCNRHKIKCPLKIYLVNVRKINCE